MRQGREPVDSTDDPLVFPDGASWRDWLIEYRDRVQSVWLVIAKKGTEPPGLRYEVAVEEALCFGWVDSQARKLDDLAYLLRFSPRRPNSVWARSNIDRVSRLIREGRMTEAGQGAIEYAKTNGQWEAALRRELVDVIPPDLEQALSHHAGAVAAYLQIRPSRRKQLLHFLDSAKRPETRARRIRFIVDEVTG